MKELYAKMRKAAMGRVWLGLFMTLFGVFMVFGGCAEEIDYLTASENIYDMSTMEMRATSSGSSSVAEFYKFEGASLIDWYAYDSEGYYYIWLTADDKYMGLYVYNEQRDLAEKIVEESWAYWNGETTEKPTDVLSGTGYVYYMTDDEQAYFNEYFSQADAGASVTSNLVYETFVMTPFDEVVSGSDFIVALVGLIFTVCGIVYFLGFLTGAYKKQPAKFIQQHNLSEPEVVSDLTYALHRKKADIGKRYVLLYGDKSYLMSYDQLLWTYVSITKTKHRTYGIPTGTTYSYQVFFVTRDKQKYDISVKTEDEGKEIVADIAEMAPHVICGYHEDLDSMFKSNFAQLIKIVDDKKAELASQAEGAAQESAEPDQVSMSGFSMDGSQRETAAATDIPESDYTEAASDGAAYSSTGDMNSYDHMGYDSSYSGASQSGLDPDTFGGSSSGFKLNDK